jgi:2-amino-1-hydroxyethylphosphonate dioxygenase (glycine-forming)
MTNKEDMEVVDEIENLYKEYGQSDYIGERVTQLEHALQTAALAEEVMGNDDEFIVACLLHDIGHLLGVKYNWEEMKDLGILHHEQRGADWLAQRGFPPEVTELVRNHINPKRYLLSIDPVYRAQLSEASIGTLEFQGGLMTSQEIVEFEQQPLFARYVQLRKLDDCAKIVGKKTYDFSEYREKLLKVLTHKCS